jgi:hypothetical protein
MEIVLFFLPELKTCNQIKKNIPLLEKLTYDNSPKASCNE